MKLTPIFVSDASDDGLWSIQQDGESQSEFEKFFDLVNDIEWLHDFFENNSTDLHRGFFGKITMAVAISRTLEEAEDIEDALYEYSELGFQGKETTLQHLFKPLNNFEYVITRHQKTKARIRKSWLRLYAIRLAENCYLITGGAIKLTQDMRRDHLNYELIKLDQTKQFLRENGIDYPEDLNISNNE
jgi:hypothetical protein